MKKDFELRLLETVSRSEGRARLEYYITVDSSCINKKPQQEHHYCTACKPSIKLVSKSGICTLASHTPNSHGLHECESSFEIWHARFVIPVICRW